MESLLWQFAGAIKEKDYDKAYSYLGIRESYEELIDEEYPVDHTPSVIEGTQKIRDNGFAWYDEVCKEKFLQKYRAGQTGQITGRNGSQYWKILYDADLE